jgi:hypothetical protein
MTLITLPSAGVVWPGSDPEDDDSICDRRLSDLLPVEIVRQIGFDPNSYLFERPIRRRNTDPVSCPIGAFQSRARRSISLDRGFPDVSPSLNIRHWFTVEVSDAVVVAFSQFPIAPNATGCVLLRDGKYLRIGQIIEQVHEQTLSPFSPQICALDKDSELGDYLAEELEIAQRLARTFAKATGLRAKVENIELTSYQHRITLKIKVSTLEDPHLDSFARYLIQVFACAVEFWCS